MTVFNRDFVDILRGRLAESLNFIQVLIGPRQVGKTTGVRAIAEQWQGAVHFETADAPTPPGPEWLNLQFDIAEQRGAGTLLIIDEVQKITGWSEVVKLRFDRARSKRSLKIVLLGSASLSLQKGLTESLAGRYELINAHHWSFAECHQAFGWSLPTYLAFGGYPAPVELITAQDRWRRFMRESIIEPVLGRDIQGTVRIDKPALFRRSLEVAMNYPAQTISLQKFLGQLQEGGNVSTLKHYLELLEGAFLIKVLSKYSRGVVATRASSPKILPLAPALIHAFQSPDKLQSDPAWRGRVFESVIGARLATHPGDLYYWSHGKHEVDFVHEYDGVLTAYEIKSGASGNVQGLTHFKRLYPHAVLKVIDWDRGEDLLLRKEQDL
jgi:predicted AAA+ superfamily ATPase